MMKRVKEFGATDGLSRLSVEHAEIDRAFGRLDEAIVRGLGLKKILSAAERLTRQLTLHYIHETQFLEKLSPVMLRLHRRTEEELMAQIASVYAGLRRREMASALQLRGLWKSWRRDHIYGMGEAVEFMLQEPFDMASRANNIQVRGREARL